MTPIIGTYWKTELCKALARSKAHGAVVITDSTVQGLYGVDMLRIVKQCIPNAFLLTFPAGERSKNQSTVTRLQHGMLRHGCGRDTVVVALGGGVVGDVAGFVAATYHRGIPVIQVPTTLLAMVDSSIGGKTGIDTAYGKNTIGAFWQPLAVCMNVAYLATLDEAHIRSGLLEAVKIFIARSPSTIALAQRFYRTRSQTDAVRVVRRAVALKKDIVQRDERERGERMVLNVGHTIGHALEQLSGYRLLHGMAVGLGMIVETRIAELMGVMPSGEQRAIETILEEFGVEKKVLNKFSVQGVLAATRADKKNRNGVVRYVLLKRRGVVYAPRGIFAQPVPDAIVKEAIQFFS